MRLDARERSTIVSALKYWKRVGGSAIQKYAYVGDEEGKGPLNDAEVDALCARTIEED